MTIFKKTHKEFIKLKFSILLKKSTIWRFYRPFAEFNASLYKEKKDEEKLKKEEDWLVNFPFIFDLKVLNGPFEGLKYPESRSLHSTFVPKLLGTYESELHPVFNELKEINFSKILDVGCAEGYYAVGLARIFPKAQIVAYDINIEAKATCEKMGILNGIKIPESLLIKENCDELELLNLPPNETNLIISDCEGFESELFTPSVCGHLKNSFLIIEAHDFIVPGVSEALQERFGNSHLVRVIKNVDDLFKPRFFNVPQLDGFSLDWKIKLMAEKRPSQMEWIYCSPKNLF